jgi:large subunit ribosomal protein L4
MKLPVYNSLGVASGRELELNEDIFSVKPNEHVVYLDVKHILANKRQGTHKTKEKSSLSGSTRKLIKQKGTGGARKGSIKSPLFRGGARIFGPTPRSYSFKLNKKVKKLARKSVLSYKCSESAIILLDNLALFTHKTKEYNAFLKAFNLEFVKTLVILGDLDKNVVLASRNLAQAQVVDAKFINTYDLLNADRIVIAENALPVITDLLL